MLNSFNKILYEMNYINNKCYNKYCNCIGSSIINIQRNACAFNSPIQRSNKSSTTRTVATYKRYNQPYIRKAKGVYNENIICISDYFEWDTRIAASQSYISFPFHCVLVLPLNPFFLGTAYVEQHIHRHTRIIPVHKDIGFGALA